MASKYVVKFLQHHGCYNTNEQAGFDKAVADRMVALGVAKILGPAKEPTGHPCADPSQIKKA